MTAPLDDRAKWTFVCPRCGNREQNEAAALFHQLKLCPKAKEAGDGAADAEGRP